MKRREALRVVGAAAVLSLQPRSAGELWARVARGEPATDRGRALTADQLLLVRALGDTILPRTDTPSASDVKVPEWIALVVADGMTDGERAAFLEGLAAADREARRVGDRPFAALGAADRQRAMAALDPGEGMLERLLSGSPDTKERYVAVTERVEDWFGIKPSHRAFAPVKALVVRGYMTSEPIWRGVLEVPVMPGRFDGDVPHVPHVLSRGGR